MRQRQKILTYQKEIFPLILQELKVTKDDAFAEQSIHALFAGGKNCADEIVHIIQEHQREFISCPFCSYC
jgi:hypothetical protein